MMSNDHDRPYRTSTIPYSGSRGSKRSLAAAGLAVGALACIIIEAVVAAGWRSPGYSYVNGYISDLASRDCGPFEGRTVCSPRWAAIDVTWIAEGLLAAAACLLLAAALAARSRRIVSALALALGVGFVLFAVFPKSASTQASGTIGVYWAGAVLVLVAGNALAMALGAAWRQLGISRRVGRAGVLLGAIGIVSAIATIGWVPIGVAERISTYSFLLWQLVLAVALVWPRPAVPR